MRETTISEYEKAVNRVIDYINQNLFNTPGIREIADVANISGFHFHRIFKTIIGENIGEYITRIRLEYIALRLLTSKDSLADIALWTGYGTKHSLSKAFKKHFGVPPSIFRLQPKHTEPFFGSTERETMFLAPRLVHLAPKTIVYIRIIDTYGAEKSYKDAWHRLGIFAKEKKLTDHTTEFIGLSFDDPAITAPDKCRFYASFTPNRDVQPEGPFGVRQIAGRDYLVFVHHGAYHKLKDTYFNIYMRWLPEHKVKTNGSISFEKYLNSPSMVSESMLLTEIYIPIKNDKRNRGQKHIIETER